MRNVFTGSVIFRSEDLFPKVIGSRSALTVLLPVPESLFAMLPLSLTHSFRVTPIFFNIGINEMATIAESIGSTRPQEQSNIDNFDRLNEYFHRFKKLSTTVSADSSVKTSEFVDAVYEKPCQRPLMD